MTAEPQGAPRSVTSTNGDRVRGDELSASDEQRAERILAEELRRLRWTRRHLWNTSKNDPRKLNIARRLRADTTMTWAWIATRLNALAGLPNFPHIQ